MSSPATDQAVQTLKSSLSFSLLSFSGSNAWCIMEQITIWESELQGNCLLVATTPWATTLSLCTTLYHQVKVTHTSQLQQEFFRKNKTCNKNRTVIVLSIEGGTRWPKLFTSYHSDLQSGYLCNACSKDKHSMHLCTGHKAIKTESYGSDLLLCRHPCSRTIKDTCYFTWKW